LSNAHHNSAVASPYSHEFDSIPIRIDAIIIAAVLNSIDPADSAILPSKNKKYFALKCAEWGF
jgi:hypothetical protein